MFAFEGHQTPLGEQVGHGPRVVIFVGVDSFTVQTCPRLV